MYVHCLWFKVHFHTLSVESVCWLYKIGHMIDHMVWHGGAHKRGQQGTIKSWKQNKMVGLVRLVITIKNNRGKTEKKKDGGERG